jgi:hypothetical protein
MLADPRSITLASNFVHQWLDMKRLDEIVPDSTVFPTRRAVAIRATTSAPS